MNAIKLPVRIQYTRGVAGKINTVIAGTPGAFGDAGWTVVECADRAEAARIRREYPQAAMPAWKRFDEIDRAGQPGGESHGAD